RRGEEMNHLPERVDARVGPAAGGRRRPSLGQHKDGILERLLNGPEPGLALPAVEVSAIVTEDQLDVPHDPDGSPTAGGKIWRKASSSRRRRSFSASFRPHELAGSSLSSSSAIWTALVAAPLRRLSLTHQKSSTLERLRSWRIRPTKTSSRPAASAAKGYLRFVGSSTRLTPGATAQSARASSTVIGRSVSTRIDSLWQNGTGTRTHVGETSMVESPMILRVSLTTFSSSLVYPPGTNSSICGMQLPM